MLHGLLKQKYAKKYSIPTTYPDDLKQFADTTPTGDIVFIQPKKKRGPQPKIIETSPNLLNHQKNLKTQENCY